MEYPQDTDRTTLSGGETISEEMIGIDGAINASLEISREIRSGSKVRRFSETTVGIDPSRSLLSYLKSHEVLTGGLLATHFKKLLLYTKI